MHYLVCSTVGKRKEKRGNQRSVYGCQAFDIVLVLVFFLSVRICRPLLPATDERREVTSWQRICRVTKRWKSSKKRHCCRHFRQPLVFHCCSMGKKCVFVAFSLFLVFSFTVPSTGICLVLLGAGNSSPPHCKIMKISILFDSGVCVARRYSSFYGRR